MCVSVRVKSPAEDRGYGNMPRRAAPGWGVEKGGTPQRPEAKLSRSATLRRIELKPQPSLFQTPVLFSPLGLFH